MRTSRFTGAVAVALTAVALLALPARAAGATAPAVTAAEQRLSQQGPSEQGPSEAPADDGTGASADDATGADDDGAGAGDEIDEPLPGNDIIPQPNSGREPEDAGDRGGALQVLLAALIVAGLSAMVAMVVRESRRNRAGVP